MSTTHPQVGAYLDDLARMLTDIDPGERDDILASVREHLDAEIGDGDGDGGDAVVHAALLRLGPPEQVAAEARADTTPRPPLAAWPTAHAPPRTPTPGLARVGAVVVALTVLLPTLAMGADRVQQLVAPDRMPMFVGLPFVLLLGMTTPWLAGVICVMLARGLTPTTRLWLTLLGPLVGVVVIAGTFWAEPRLVSAAVSAVAAAVVVLGTFVLMVRAWREVGR